MAMLRRLDTLRIRMRVQVLLVNLASIIMCTHVRVHMAYIFITSVLNLDECRAGSRYFRAHMSALNTHEAHDHQGRGESRHKPDVWSGE